MAILSVRSIGATTWIALPDSSELELGSMDLDSEDGTGRDALGNLFRDRVAVKTKITATWGALNQTQLNTIINAVTDVFFQLSYPDGSSRKTITVYVGDRVRNVKRYYTDTSMLFQGFSLSFIEQ